MSNPFLHSGQPVFDDNIIHQNIPPNTFDGGGADWMTWGGQSYTTNTISSLITVKVNDLFTAGYYPCELISPIAGDLAYQMYVPMMLQTSAILAEGDMVMAQIIGGVTVGDDYILCQHVGYTKGSFFAVISGEGAAGDCCQGQSYSWKEVAPLAGGLWTIKTDGLAGSNNAYEVNGNCIAHGTIVEMHLSSIGDYRFNQCCSPCNIPPFLDESENIEITEDVTLEIITGGTIETDCCENLLPETVTLTFTVTSGSCDACVPSTYDIDYNVGLSGWEDPGGFCPAGLGWRMGFYCGIPAMGQPTQLFLISGLALAPSFYVADSVQCEPLQCVYTGVPLPGGCTCTITVT